MPSWLCMCGVFGVFAPGQPVAHLTYLGLYALQHRGQESAGMAVADDGASLTVVKDMGLVPERVRRPHPGRAVGQPRHRPLPLQHHRVVHLAQRPARLPRRRPPPVRPRPQRQPHQHRGAGRRRRHAARHGHQRHRPRGRAAGPAHDGHRLGPGRRPRRRAAHARGGLLVRADGRRPDHRRPRPRRLPAAVPRPARRRLGAGLGDAGARHRGRRLRAGARAGRDRRHRRRRPPHACGWFRRGDDRPPAVPVRVRLLRPPRRPALRQQRGRRPGPHGRAAGRAGAAGRPIASSPSARRW